MMRTGLRPAKSLHEPRRGTINRPTEKPARLMYRFQWAVKVSTSCKEKNKQKQLKSNKQDGDFFMIRDTVMEGEDIQVTTAWSLSYPYNIYLAC